MLSNRVNVMSARAWGRRGGLRILMVMMPIMEYSCFRTFSPISDPKCIIEKLESCAADLEEDMVDAACFLSRGLTSPGISRNVLAGLGERLLSNISWTLSKVCGAVVLSGNATQTSV